MSARAALRYGWRGTIHVPAWRAGESKVPMTQPLLAEYFPILVFLGIAGGVAIAMVGGAFLAARQKPYAEKLSTYECGFAPFEDTRHRFDVRFYLIAILFILFDLEIAFLIPWAVSLADIGHTGFITGVVFLFDLLVGFIYAWKVGALDWE